MPGPNLGCSWIIWTCTQGIKIDQLPLQCNRIRQTTKSRQPCASRLEYLNFTFRIRTILQHVASYKQRTIYLVRTCIGTRYICQKSIKFLCINGCLLWSSYILLAPPQSLCFHLAILSAATTIPTQSLSYTCTHIFINCSFHLLGSDHILLVPIIIQLNWGMQLNCSICNNVCIYNVHVHSGYDIYYVKKI